MSGMLNPTATHSAEVEWLDEPVENVVLAEGKQLRGRLIDTYGKPHVGVVVQAIQEDVVSTGAAITDKRGVFTFAVAPTGEVLLGVFDKTYAAPLDVSSFDIIVDG